MNASALANYVKIIEALGPVFVHHMEARAAARALAEQAGVSVADLDAADERFARVFTDPLKDE